MKPLPGSTAKMAKRGRGRPRKTGPDANQSTVLLTREERARRRQKIADEIRRGKDHATVAQQYGVSVQTITNACIEHGVDASLRSIGRGRGQVRPADEFLQILAWLIEGHGGGTIAEEFGVTRQYVSLVRQRAEENGIFEAVKNLGKAIPEYQPANKIDDKVKFEIVRLIGDGKTKKEIAEKTELHISTIFEIQKTARESGLL